jgi:hypothetical protein
VRDVVQKQRAIITQQLQLSHELLAGQVVDVLRCRVWNPENHEGA